MRNADDSDDRAVLFTVHENVGHVELNRPEVYNALDVGLARGLESALQEADRDDQVRAVVLSGRGKAFCAGGDIKAMAVSAEPAAMVKDLVEASHRVVRTLVGLRKPVVAAVHGSAAGAGLGYACAADLVVAGSSARFLSAFIAIGLTPDSSTSWFLPQIVGLRRALELTMLNRVLTAREAMEWGLVSSVHADEDVRAAGLDLAAKLAAAPSLAMSGTRRLVREASNRRLDQHLDLEAASIVSMAATPEARRLLSALAAR
jgi:2-(1,2-epoxy-1,2-dihydrophenyl)acetyl-CoA isomerase